MPPTDGPHETLNHRYLHVRTRYDERAMWYKRWRIRLWLIALCATWGPLLLAILGLSGRLTADWNAVLLHNVIPILGTVNFAVNTIQVVTSPRGRWLEYRAATERLREQAMLFRTGLPPYDTPDAERRFNELLNQLTDRLGADDPSHPARPGRGWLRTVIATVAFWRSVAWRIFVGRLSLALRGLPAPLRESIDHPPDDGLFPRFTELSPTDRVALVRRRLLHQRLWHLRKSGRYYSWYLTFQLSIAGLSALIAGYSYFVGRSFFWYGAATAASLSLMAWRDFLECAPLSMRYYQLARSLEELENRVANLEKKAGLGGVSDEELAQVVDDGERLIGGEFRSWKLVHEVIPTD